MIKQAMYVMLRFKKQIVIVLSTLSIIFPTLVADVGKAFAQSLSCSPQELPHYIEIIKTEKDQYKFKQAIDCAVKVSPTKETVDILTSRLQQALKDIVTIEPGWFPTVHGDICVALADGLRSLNDTTGYEMIAAYFISVDWNNRRDREFFDSIAAHAAGRPELNETFYLALTRMPVLNDSTLGRACSVFHRMNDRRVIRDDPKYILGIVKALTRLGQAKIYPPQEWMIETCNQTLISQLLDEKMRQSFMAVYLDQLSADEKLVLDRFLAKIAPPPNTEVIEQLATAFSAVPWKAEFSVWQKGNPEFSCETFRGQGYVTHVDDLWCYDCRSKSTALEKRYYFYPGADGKGCTLQKIDLSYPTTEEGVVSALSKKLAARMGPGTVQSKVYEFGSAHWKEISYWNYQGRETYAFRNTYNSFRGKGAPTVEILARDPELLSISKKEMEAEHAIKQENQQRQNIHKERLYQDVSRNHSDVVKRQRSAKTQKTKHDILIEFLPKIAKEGADRAADLYFAEQIAEDLARFANLEDLIRWGSVKPALSTYGVVYRKGYDGTYYNRAFLKRIIDEGLPGYWAEEAYLDWLSMACDESSEEDMFKKVIAQADGFLKKNPKPRIQKHLIFSLAQAHETGWSLSLAHNQDAYTEHQKYQEEAPAHKKKAIFYYEQLIKEYPDSSESLIARIELNYLKMDMDTNSREFFCIFD